MNIESNASLTEDQMFTQRQSARHVCVALKKYFECHLVLKVNELKRSHARSEGGSPHHEIPAYKVGNSVSSFRVLFMSCKLFDFNMIQGSPCKKLS